MADFATLDDLDVDGRTVLVRADLNVPVQDGEVSDDTRLVRLAPTVRELAKKGAKVVLLSHFGRPKGGPEAKYSLKPVAERLAEILKVPVAFAADCVGPQARKVVDALPPGGVAVLENTRFHAGEEKNDEGFARELAALGDLYVNDAFSAAHRAHASTEAIARLLPSAAGRLMQEELEHLQKALEKPERPVCAVVGGAKVSSKLDLLGNLVGRVDMLVIGGGMANTFLAARGLGVGKSLCEHELAGKAREIEEAAAKAGCAILLPEDVVVAERFEADAPHRTVAADAVPANSMILDLGPKSVQAFIRALGECRTLVWNGPLGAFETPPFDRATVEAAKAAAALTKEGRLLSVAGGGDTVAALAHAGVVERFSYVSTAGGAFLEWLEGKTLPGVAALRRL